MIVVAAWGLVLTAASPAAAEASPPVVLLVPAGSATASVAAAHLSAELGQALPTAVVSGAPPPSILLERQAQWPGRILVYLHPEANEAWMLRPGSTEPVVRRLQHPPASPSYPLAIAAAELVRNATSHPPPAPPLPLELAVSVGLGLSGADGDEEVLMHPVFGLDLRLRADWLWSSAGLRLRGPSASATDAVSATSIDYSRFDMALRLGLGAQLASWVIAGFLETGLSRVSIEARRDDELLGAHSRWPFTLGLGVELRRMLTQGFGVFLCAAVVHAFDPADFVGNGEPLYSEGRWRVQSQVGLEWAL